MTRTILTGLMLALTTSGVALASSADDEKAMQPGKYGEEAAAAGDTEEKKVTVGNEGQAASMAVDETTLTPESNVEETEEKKDISDVKGEPSTE